VLNPDSTVESRPIEIDENNGAVAVITSGVKDGEQVVTAGQYRLQPKSHVQVRQAATAANAPATKDAAEKKSP